LQIKFINKVISVDKQSFQIGALHVDKMVEDVYNILRTANNPVLFDVGANVGAYSLIAALISNLTVYAFEPYPEVCEVLKKNIRLNDLQDQVKVFEIGMYERRAIKKLKCCKGSHSGLSCIGSNFQLKIPYDEKEIETDTIDNVVERESIKKVDFIKIDTEGCGYFVLKGAEKTIKKYHPIILAECVQRRTVNFNLTPDDIINLLKDYGYQIFEDFSENDILAKKGNKIL
jgi:FkbM family methyltransferase